MIYGVVKLTNLCALELLAHGLKCGHSGALIPRSGLSGGKTEVVGVENRGLFLSGASSCSILEYGLLKSGGMHYGQSSDLQLFSLGASLVGTWVEHGIPSISC